MAARREPHATRGMAEGGTSTPKAGGQLAP